MLYVKRYTLSPRPLATPINELCDLEQILHLDLKVLKEEGTPRGSLVAPYLSAGRKSPLATLVAYQ